MQGVARAVCLARRALCLAGRARGLTRVAARAPSVMVSPAWVRDPPWRPFSPRLALPLRLLRPRGEGRARLGDRGRTRRADRLVLVLLAGPAGVDREPSQPAQNAYLCLTGQGRAGLLSSWRGCALLFNRCVVRAASPCWRCSSACMRRVCRCSPRRTAGSARATRGPRRPLARTLPRRTTPPTSTARRAVAGARASRWGSRWSLRRPRS